MADSVQQTVQVRGVSKTFGTGRSAVQVLRDVNLDLSAGERLVLLGASGCGKTTLLRCIAGLEVPNAGRISIQGKTVYDQPANVLLPPDKRDVNLVFQSYALWPHLSVFENVAFPLRSARTPEAGVKSRVASALDMAGVGHLADRYPAQLSGGQQQRVALARAVVGRDGLVLFDEPLSNVDAHIRETLRAELVQLQQQIGFSAIYVTHDQIEAAALADRIAIMSQGVIEQVGTPQELYHSPATAYVAEFFGTTNRLDGVVRDVTAGLATVDTAAGPLRAPIKDHRPGDKVRLLFRPEALSVDAGAGQASEAANHLTATVGRASFLGFYSDVHLSCGSASLLLRLVNQEPPAAGVRLQLRLDPAAVKLFAAG